VSNQPGRGLLEILQQVPDPRGREGLRHPMSAMLAAIICAHLCGHQGLRQTVRWLQLQGVAMWHLLGFTRKPPVRQTYSNVLAEIDPQVLERVILEFVSQLECVPSDLMDKPVKVKPKATTAVPLAASPVDVEVWDGKTLRGTRKGDCRAEQVLVRMQAVLGTILGSQRIPLETNESKTALEMAKSLVLKGKLVVGDAAYCQRDICQQIARSDGDYLVTVKGNQPQLLRDIEQAFVIPQGFSPLCS
jgi:hypothetical protein